MKNVWYEQNAIGVIWRKYSMSSSGVLQLEGLQEDTTPLTNASAMMELTDEELAQVTGADGWGYMRHMRQGGCEHGGGRRIRFSLTHIHIEYRLDFLNYNL